MARIELRNTTIKLKDGFGGTAAVNDSSIAGGNSTLDIDTVANLTGGGTHVPVGARFTIATVDETYTVTAQNSNEVQQVVTDGTTGHFTISTTGTAAAPVSIQTTASILYSADAATVQTALEGLAIFVPGDVLVTKPSSGHWLIEFTGNFADKNMVQMTATDVDLGVGETVSVTTISPGETTHKLTFSPTLDGGDLPADDGVITFLPQEITIKIGEGELKYTENTEYKYDLDRGNLDTVRQGDEQPMDVSLAFTYESITTGTDELISPMDAIKRRGGASGWFSSATDQCEPYAIDVEVLHTPPCGTTQSETTLFPDFRSDKRDVSFKDALITVTGKCNAVEPIVSRA